MKLKLLFAGLLLVSAPAMAGPKVAICHVSGNSGSVHMLNVSANALSAHLAHGDWLPQTWYVDADGDGYGAVGDPGVVACIQPAGTSINATDCADNAAAINPGAVEICGNGVDDNCSGEADEGCMSDIEITISADNAYYLWVDGQPYSGTYAANWMRGDTFSFQLPQGNHAIAVYTEDWGGYAYLAATVRVDGQIVSKTGDGSWRTLGSQYANSQSRNTYQRGYNWPMTPADGTTGLEVTPPQNWTDVLFDDSGWLHAGACSDNRLPSYAAATHPDWDTFDAFLADGAKFVYTTSNCRPAKVVQQPNGSYQFYWAIGVFRTTFSF